MPWCKTGTILKTKSKAGTAESKAGTAKSKRGTAKSKAGTTRVRGGLMNEEHEVKNALLDENVFFKSVIQNAAAPMFVIDISHEIIIWNNALAKLTGKSSFQMVGTKQQWAQFYPTKRPVLADLVIDQQLNQIDEYYASTSYSLFTEGSLRAEGWYENLGGNGTTFVVRLPRSHQQQ